ncbi:MAG: DUF2156 domain-containing protein [Candidatus Latescibacteria bacterium]|nr:DUF2156 domain-containing protein [Candidatus Latescibacterota bacterium]
MDNNWGEPITPAHANLLQGAFAAAQKNAWCYYPPFLCAFSLPPNRVVRVLQRADCVCVMVERPDGMDFLCPPVPFVANVFDGLVDELVAFNGARSTRVLWVDAEDALRLDSARFIVKEKDAEYVYDPKLIVKAEGREFRDIRKRVHRFEREYTAVFRPLLAEDIDACHVVLRYWRKRQGRKHPFLLDWGYTRAALDGFAGWPRELLGGWCVEIEGELKAFALAGEMRPDFAQFFVAKADPDILGLAEFLRCCVYEVLSEYRLVNDAGDLGLEGLRQFKMKFRPVDRLQMFSAEVRKEGC